MTSCALQLAEHAPTLGPPSDSHLTQRPSHPTSCTAISRQCYGWYNQDFPSSGASAVSGITCRHAHIILHQKFQQELFQEIRDDDKLVVMARGLGLLRVLTNLLHSYDAAGDNLVLVVGATPREVDLLGEGLL